MNSYFRIDVDLVAAVVLAVIMVIAFKRLDRRDGLNRAFLYTSLIVVVQLVVEALTCLMNGIPGGWVRPTAIALHVILFIAAPTLTWFWYRLSRHVAGPVERLTSLRSALILAPLAVNVVLTLFSAFSGIFFAIDADNVYHRGPLFLLASGITYFYLLLALSRIIVDRRKFVLEDIVLMIAATVMPILGGLLQSLFYGILLMWPSVAFSLVILFIFLEQRLVRVDSLTGAWTRESFEYYVSRRQKSQAPFGLVYLDLDGLKEINDGFGHHEGDSALKAVADAVKRTLGPDDFIVRLGGDEFLAFVDGATSASLVAVVDAARANIDRYNASAQKPYRVSASFGYDVRNPGFAEAGDFVRHVDRLMYEGKNRKRAPRR